MKATAQMGGLTRPEAFNYLPAQWRAYIVALESVRSEALDLRQFVNAAGISGCDAPHEVIEKLQLVINVAALKREPNAALSPARVAEGEEEQK